MAIEALNACSYLIACWLGVWAVFAQVHVPGKVEKTPAALMVTIEDRRAHLSIHLMNGELSVEGKHSSQLIKLIVAASLIRNSIEYPSLLRTL
jgi:hypothetical protein